MPEERDGPSLEPPSLFGRKKKRAEPLEVSSPPSSPHLSSPVAQDTRTVSSADDDSPTTIFDDTSEPTADATALVAPDRPAREAWLGGRPAAILTGLVVGALIVGATAGSLRICTEAKGTPSCGDQGFFLLVAILVVAVLIGTALLRVAHVPEPGSTSFLAVGLLSVVILLFLVDTIFEWWMVIVIPLVSAATYLASHWVASTYIDPS